MRKFACLVEFARERLHLRLGELAHRALQQLLLLSQFKIHPSLLIVA
jgi:hypothetical protein